jgi:hypothetical protein
MAMESPSRSQVEQLVRERLASDPEFREQLLRDPIATLGELLSLEIPEKIQVVVHEAAPGELHLIIPSTEVSDDELEAAVGAGFTLPIPIS